MGKTKQRIDLSNIEPGTEIKFPKEKYELGPEFEESDLGYDEGQIRQFRGPNNGHVLEFNDYYLGHVDRVDPREDPIGHLFLDAPETVVVSGAGIMGGLIGFSLFKGWKGKKSDKTVWIMAFLAILIILLLIIFYFIKDSQKSARRTIIKS